MMKRWKGKKNRQDAPSSSREAFNPLVDHLDLEELMGDSPMARDNMKRVNAGVEAYAGCLKSLIKAAEELRQRKEDHLRALHGFVHELSTSFSDFFVPDDPLYDGLQKVCTSLQEVSAHTELEIEQLQHMFVTAVGNFMDTEVSPLKEESRVVATDRRSYDSLAEKCSHVTKRETASTKFVESRQQMIDAQRRFHSSTLRHGVALNHVQTRKRTEIVDRALAFWYSQRVLYHNANKLFTQMEPTISAIAKDVEQVKGECKEDVVRERVTCEQLLSSATVGGHVVRPRDNGVRMEGYLHKLGTSVTHRWHKRYFVIKDGMMTYYKSQGAPREAEASKSINLLVSMVKEAPDAERPFCFEIINPDRVTVLQAPSAMALSQWMKAIPDETESLLQQQRLSGECSPRDGGASPSSVSGLGASSRHLLPKLVALDPTNSRCADCDAADPTWAATNLGVLFCIDCSGIHRSLGSHVSKVRSFQLDGWEPEYGMVMKALGNGCVNAIFEAHLDTADVEKPDPTASREHREAWIRAKYAKRQFVTPFQDGDITALDASLVVAVRNDAPLATLLLQIAQGANVDSRVVEDEHNATALIVAVQQGSATTVEFLLQNGANVRLADAKGNTALHHASRLGHAGIAGILFKRGAPLDVTNANGHTPKDLALAEQHADCATLLRLAILSLEERPGDRDSHSFREVLAHFSGMFRDDESDEAKLGQTKEPSSSSSSSDHGVEYSTHVDGSRGDASEGDDEQPRVRGDDGDQEEGKGGETSPSTEALEPWDATV